MTTTPRPRATAALRERLARVRSARRANRTHTQDGTLARSLLSQAIDDADVDARNVVELLDGIAGAYERAQLGLDQGRSGQTVSLDDLWLVARVELAAAAVEDLERLIHTHSLASTTKDRVRRSLRPLEQFPLLGASLEGRWAEYRFVLGPWRWLVIVYAYFEAAGRVVVVTMQDGRSSAGRHTEAR